jgi:hypothetical protein
LVLPGTHEPSPSQKPSQAWVSQSGQHSGPAPRFENQQREPSAHSLDEPLYPHSLDARCMQTPR